MATGTSMSREQVKSTCNSLECSPSKGDSSGKYGGKPSVVPGANREKLTAGTSEFKGKK